MTGELDDRPAKLELRGVRLRRGRFTLDVPSLALREGEVLAVMGPNGSGKSTLLHTAALLERPQAGELRFDGVSVRGSERKYRRRMAVVFQEPLLLDRSVRANVSLGLRLRGLRERRAREDRWLEAFGVLHLADRVARSLSGGEAQRVNLARAFALQPEVLLLDEPFASLDAPSRESLADLLSRLIRETGVTALFVTHDRGEALRFGDRIAVLIDGRVRQVGPAQEVFTAPSDAEIAAFVGIETILSGRVTEHSDGVVQVQVGPAEAGVLIDAAVGSEIARDVLVCVRPEDVTIGEVQEGTRTSARNQFIGKVVRVATSGLQVRVELDCGVPLVALITQRSARELDVREGAPYLVAFKASAVHLIPRAEGR
ncbi:MAG TPA: ABC transporter ATP-binding protein [Dehalococcoidia bacterium]|nr:ABC transporter ATP-binding protein [Dehalococcoidia bacterium]